MSDARNKIVDDLTGLLTGLGVVAQDAGDEVAEFIRARIRTLIAEEGLVTREEFEMLRDTLTQLQAENAELRARLDAVEK